MEFGGVWGKTKEEGKGKEKRRSGVPGNIQLVRNVSGMDIPIARLLGSDKKISRGTKYVLCVTGGPYGIIYNMYVVRVGALPACTYTRPM